MEKINTGIYIRVSTDEQVKHGYSIKAQKDKLVNFAQIKEWNIYKIYIDEGVSGKNLNRPKVKELINDVKNKSINNILVYKIDRLTRSTKDLIELIEMFSKYNCEFNSLTESIDTSSPSGRMFIKIIGLFAEFERETIAERIKIGFERKVKEGYSICSSTSSYGYSRIKGKKIQIIKKDEALIVRKIFKMYQNNKSIKEIKKYLLSKKVPTKKNKTWSNKMITNILTNPNYIGKVRYGINRKDYFENDGKHQSIISRQEFMSIQKKINNQLKTKEDAYYSNKLICMCGKKMHTKRTYINNKIYINYTCKNKSCLFKSISHKFLDRYFNINNMSIITQKDIIQNIVKEIRIISLKKELKILYNCVKLEDKNFTLLKK